MTRPTMLLLVGLAGCSEASSTAAAGSTGAVDPASSGNTASVGPLPSSSTTGPDAAEGSMSTAFGSTTGGASSSGQGADSGTSGSTSGVPRPNVVVQFVGNSYTAAGVVPMLTALADEAGVLVETRVIAPGGQTLEGHWMTGPTVEAITAQDVNAVALQGQSLEPWLGSDSFLEHAELLGNTACDAGAEVFLFQTWARAAGHEAYDFDPAVTDPDALQAILSDTYAAAADTSCATVVPVGDAWQRVWTEYPEIELFGGDGSHPSAAGTYLAACVFAEAMLGVDVEGSWAPDGIEVADASRLQATAGCVVARDCP